MEQLDGRMPNLGLRRPNALAESQRLLCESPANKAPDFLPRGESRRLGCLRYLCAVWSLPSIHRQQADWGGGHESQEMN